MAKKRGSRFFIEFADKGAGKTCEKAKQGRSNELLTKLNTKLFHRYYYFSRIVELRYDRVLEALMEEFDLSEVTIIKIIANNTTAIKEIGDKRMTRAQLKSKYPSYNWNDKPAYRQVKQREVYKGMD